VEKGQSSRRGKHSRLGLDSGQVGRHEDDHPRNLKALIKAKGLSAPLSVGIIRIVHDDRTCSGSVCGGFGDDQSVGRCRSGGEGEVEAEGASQGRGACNGSAAGHSYSPEMGGIRQRLAFAALPALPGPTPPLQVGLSAAVLRLCSFVFVLRLRYKQQTALHLAVAECLNGTWMNTILPNSMYRGFRRDS
jgi:hypothetical protein